MAIGPLYMCKVYRAMIQASLHLNDIASYRCETKFNSRATHHVPNRLSNIKHSNKEGCVRTRLCLGFTFNAMRTLRDLFFIAIRTT